MKRLNYSEVAPAGAKALYGVHHYITNSTALPEELIHLVFLRVSQISDFFAQELRLAGSTGDLSWILGGYYSNKEWP